MPTTMATMWKPFSNSCMPKVKRKPVENSSVPIVAIRSPNAPDMGPLMSDPSDTTAMAVRSFGTNIAYSGGAKLDAKAARTGAARMSTNPPSRPPSAEAEIAIPIASAAQPVCASG